jgi:hypothetical protein
MNRTMFNLVAAFVWLGLAVLLLVGPTWSPELRRFALLWRFNPGWAALVLAVYNLIRWASVRTMERTQRLQNEAEHEAQRRWKPADAGAERDPAFDFQDSPPAEPNGPNSKRDSDV